MRIGSLPDSSLVAIRLGEIRRVVCGSPAYFAGHGVPQTPRDLAAHACITMNGLASPSAWTFGAGKAEQAVAVRSRLVVNTAEAAIDAAIAGLGVTRVLSYQVAAAGRTVCSTSCCGISSRSRGRSALCMPGRGLLPIKLRAFLDFAAPRLKAALSGARV